MISFPQLALLAVLAAGASGQSVPPASPTPSGSPPAVTTSPSPGLSPAPSGSPATAPGGLPSAPPTPTPKPTATPAPAPTFGYRFVPRPAASPDPTAPQILEVDLNSQRLRDNIAIRVLTNDVVTRVENHTDGRADAIPHTGPGEFIAVSKLPKIPFIARGMRITLEFVAFSADGRKTSVKVPVKLG